MRLAMSGEGRAQPGGRKARQDLDESVEGERGGHPLFPPIGLGEGEGGKEAKVGGERGVHPVFPPTMSGEGWGGRGEQGWDRGGARKRWGQEWRRHLPRIRMGREGRESVRGTDRHGKNK